MTTSVAKALQAGHRNSLERVTPQMAKADLNTIEKREFREEIGRAIQRAIGLAGLSQKEAAGEIGRDAAQLARWIAGTERPQFDALFAVERLREPLCVALAQMSGADVQLEIKFRKTA